MGEMAEYYDQLTDWQDDCRDGIDDLMTLPDNELVAETIRARSEKIKSIRLQSTNGRQLSEKQRYCLAFWISEARNRRAA